MAKPTGSEIGRLTTFGVSQEAPWRALLIPPNRYLDLRHTIHDGSQIVPSAEPVHCAIEGYVLSPASYDPAKRRSTLQITLPDRITTLRVFAFGAPSQLPDTWRRRDAQISLFGQLIAKEDGFLAVFSPTPVPASQLGRAIGVYPSRSGVIGSETVRQRVLQMVTEENLRLAASHIRSVLGGDEAESELLSAWGRLHGIENMHKTCLERVLCRLHLPLSPDQGARAKQLLTELDAYSILSAAGKERSAFGRATPVNVPPSVMERRISQMSHKPTAEQRQAVLDALGDMTSTTPMMRLLSGDVGTGKTTVFALLAVCVHDAGGEVAIMLPSSEMVQQVTSEMRAWWPDLQLEKVTGKHKGTQEPARIKLGTSALLHRYQEWKPTLTVVDEQQKHSVTQRQYLARHGGHLLEATATAMPRTLASVLFGLIPISRLTKPHTPKSIDTHLHDADDPLVRQRLFQQVKATLDDGDQVLVIFAARDKKEADKIESQAGELDLEAADMEEQLTPTHVVPLDEGAPAWEGFLPEGAVARLHGKMKAADRNRTMALMHNGDCQVLCATTAAEVGLNLPRLRRVVIYNPERLGLTQLHQIRGRVARNGGLGWCDLFTQVRKLRTSARERLDAMCQTQDGLKLAEMDMRQRGLGDLSSQKNQQSGDSSGGILLARKLTLESFEAAHQLMPSPILEVAPR